MAEQSPEWKKPSEVMKLRRRSNLGPSTCKATSVSVGQFHQSPDSVSFDRRSQKRKNPFASSQVDIRREERTDTPETRTHVSITDSIDCQQGQGQLNRILGFRRKWTDEELPAAINVCQPAATGLIGPIAQSVSSSNVDNSIIKTNDDEVSCDTFSCGAPTFPLDWSLKTKVRYLSPSQFDWCTPLRGVDESRGVEDFVRDSPLRPTKELKSADDDKTAKQQSFQRCTMYWIHPNVPWLQTFPRISRSLRQAGQVHALNQNDDVIKALYNDWCDSMNSVYLMVRHGVCPYFYVCCHNMTLLFRSAGIVRAEMHAIITPTTRGLRSALDEEGVEYSLPLLQSGSTTDSISSQQLGDTPSSNQSCAEVEDADEDDENLADDSAASIWLLDLGLDQKRYRSVDPSKVRDQRDIFRQIDYRPVSTVLVEGVANTQALFNYILNSDICFATTGSQAGLPPTILSATAFRGATLQSLKVRQGCVSEQTVTASSGYRQQMYTVEVTGPVLPNAVAGMSRLFANTTQGSFRASFAVHDPTTPFNCIKRPNASGDDDSASKQSLIDTSTSRNSPSTRLDGDVCHLEELGKNGLRELICNQGLYTWTSN